MMTKKLACLASTALVGCLLSATGAMAQSTGTEAAEQLDQVVVTASASAGIAGEIVRMEAPKSRVAISQEFIATQVPGQTILDSLNLLPSVTFTNNDAYGSAGGDISIRGFDSQRVALLLDGVPLNDSGNYEIYPNQQLDPELIERATVNLGTTDVDSPTAAAAGGTINYITRRPRGEFGVRTVLSVGEEEYRRALILVDTGPVGPLGTTAMFSAARSMYNHFNGPGEIEKTQYNARLYQDMGDGNFASLNFNYNRNRNNFVGRVSLAQFRLGDDGGNSLTTCARTNAVAGTAQTDSFGSGCVFTSTNPSDNGSIRGQFSYGLTDSLRLTIDPSFQYVLANGGSSFNFSETARQLRGNSTAAGVDLNGDGDILDNIRMFQPNTTNTRRYGVTSSLIWRLTEGQSVRLAYTYDRAKHRQTGDVTYIGPDGSPNDVFGGKDGYGKQVALPDGTNLRRRDRYSVAQLNQFAAEYRGRFVEDRLLLNLGVRAPYFERELNNYCYQRDTFTALCTTEAPIDVAGTTDGNGKTLVRFASVSGATALYGRPRSVTREYDKVLPNLGISYDLTDNQSVYFSYAQTLSAPRTDDLYDRVAVTPNVESADAFDIGYRYQSGSLIIAGAVWYNDFKNRIERTYDPATDISTSSNIGDVSLKGIDGQIGIEPMDGLTFYASASLIDSEIKSSLLAYGETALGVPLVFATAGKELPDVAKVQFGMRVGYKTENWKFGLQTKHTGQRFSNLINTEQAPRYTVFDADVRYNLPVLKRTYVQMNIKNLFDENYLGTISQGTPSGATFSNASYQPGAPRTFIVSLNVEF